MAKKKGGATQKTKDWATRTPQKKTGVNLCSPQGYSVPAPYVMQVWFEL